MQKAKAKEFFKTLKYKILGNQKKSLLRIRKCMYVISYNRTLYTASQWIWGSYYAMNMLCFEQISKFAFNNTRILVLKPNFATNYKNESFLAAFRPGYTVLYL